MLALLFALVACIYASVGFGGGSSYLALLVWWKAPYILVPALALVCNLVVVSGNAYHYLRAGYFKPALLVPFAITSVPMSYLGGSIAVQKPLFEQILFYVLLLTGLRLLLNFKSYTEQVDSQKKINFVVGGIIGGALGFLAGITGIGGGIYLAPILYNLRAGSPKQIACASSLFILLNSLSGLLGQLHKSVMLPALAGYWYLPVMVLLGGQAGNQMLLKYIPPKVAALLTAALVLGVALQLGMRMWGG